MKNSFYNVQKALEIYIDIEFMCYKFENDNRGLFVKLLFLSLINNIDIEWEVFT